MCLSQRLLLYFTSINVCQLYDLFNEFVCVTVCRHVYAWAIKPVYLWTKFWKQSRDAALSFPRSKKVQYLTLSRSISLTSAPIHHHVGCSQQEDCLSSTVHTSTNTLPLHQGALFPILPTAFPEANSGRCGNETLGGLTDKRYEGWYLRPCVWLFKWRLFCMQHLLYFFLDPLFFKTMLYVQWYLFSYFFFLMTMTIFFSRLTTYAVGEKRKKCSIIQTLLSIIYR